MQKILLRIYFLFSMVWLKSIHSYMDLYLDANETLSLTGFSGLLFYVYNGELRQNSIKHKLNVSEQKKKIYFNWNIADFQQISVNYKFKLIDLNSKDRLHKLSIDESGLVPKQRSKFFIEFDCQMNKNSSVQNSVEIGFNVQFEPNNSLSVGYEQLISMPILNFTINFRKACFKNLSNSTQSSVRFASSILSGNYAIAYVIIATLGGFSLLIMFSAFSMCLHNKLKIKKLHIQYEAIHTKLNNPMQQQYQQCLNEQLKNKINKKNKKSLCRKENNVRSKQRSEVLLEQTKKKRSKSNETIKTGTEKKHLNDDDANLNIYEAVNDSSVLNNLLNTNNASIPVINTNIDDQTPVIALNKSSDISKIPSKRIKIKRPNVNNKILLNLTTNTIQSVYNGNPNVTSTSQQFNQDTCKRVQREQIELADVYMEGTFSKIFIANLTSDILDESGTTKKKFSKVFVKTVNENASAKQIELMLKESCAFYGIKHKNLSVILALCTENTENPMALFNYFEMGNLKLYLNSIKKSKTASQVSFKSNYASEAVTKESTSNENPLISTQEILFLILQMLKALNYLHGKHILHKDIATRNCWLDENFSLKLADCALSRDMFPHDYHCLADSENKPVFWMSIESLNENLFNNATEVWSCGIFIWECFSLGAQPFENIDPFEFSDYLENNESNRLKQPIYCPDHLFEIVLKCWSSDASSRLTLKQLFYSFHKFYTTLDNYV